MDKPKIDIAYCPKCGWLLRAAYMAQELLTTFSEDLESVSLTPSNDNGRYTIRINEEILFDRKTESRFPEIKELKRLVRNTVNPDKSLGHLDR